MSDFSGKAIVTIAPLVEIEQDAKQANGLLFRILLLLSAQRLGKDGRLTDGSTQ